MFLQIFRFKPQFAEKPKNFLQESRFEAYSAEKKTWFLQIFRFKPRFAENSKNFLQADEFMDNSAEYENYPDYNELGRIIIRII